MGRSLDLCVRCAYLHTAISSHPIPPFTLRHAAFFIRGLTDIGVRCSPRSLSPVRPPLGGGWRACRRRLPFLPPSHFAAPLFCPSKRFNSDQKSVCPSVRPSVRWFLGLLLLHGKYPLEAAEAAAGQPPTRLARTQRTTHAHARLASGDLVINFPGRYDGCWTPRRPYTTSA